MTESDVVGERRRRAMEAYWDADPSENPILAGEEAIEVATRVRITPEIIQSYRDQAEGCHCDRCIADNLAATFRAAGFEVEA